MQRFFAAKGASVTPAQRPPSHARGAVDDAQRRIDDDRIAGGTETVALGAHTPPDAVPAATEMALTLLSEQPGAATAEQTPPPTSTALPHAPVQPLSSKSVITGEEQVPPAGAEQLHEHSAAAPTRPAKPS